MGENQHEWLEVLFVVPLGSMAQPGWLSTQGAFIQQHLIYLFSACVCLCERACEQERHGLDRQ